MEHNKSKLTLKGIDESTGIPFIKGIHSLDEVKTSGTYIVIARNATSEENGFPKIHGKADCCFCCEANLVVNCCYNDDESQSTNTYGQELTISDKENNTTGTYKRTVGPAGCSEWLMVATGNIELIAQNNDIVKAYNEVSANYIAAVERIDKAEDTVLKSHNTILKSATVRFDRIEENEVTINSGEIDNTPNAIVYYKPANKFVAADSAGEYWDTWDGMDAYMRGIAVRKDKVYICRGAAYIWDGASLIDTATAMFQISAARHFNYTGEYPFSSLVLKRGVDKMIIAAYIDIEYEDGKAYCFSVANKEINQLTLYKMDKGTGDNIKRLHEFHVSKMDGSQYYIAESPTIPKSWLILDWDNIQSYTSLHENDGIALSPSIFKNGGVNSRINDISNRLYDFESNTSEKITHVENAIAGVVDFNIDFENSIAIDQFQTSNKVGSSLFSSATISGGAMYVGSLNPMRYILTYMRCANRGESPQPLTKVILQIKQDNNLGKTLYSQTVDVSIQPGEIKPVLFDLGSERSFSGNLYVAVRGNSVCSPMRPADSDYPYEPSDGTAYPSAYYWQYGDIDEGTIGYKSSTTTERNFYFQTFNELAYTSAPTSGFVNSIQERLDFSAGAEISLPDKIYAVVGDTLQLFYRGMIKAVNPYNYDILVSCSKGKPTPRYFHYKPKADDVGVIDFTLNVRDNSAKTIASKTCKLHIVAAPKSPATKTNILCFGASNVVGGEWVKEVNRRLTKTGGTPAGNGLSNIEFCGSKKGDGAGWFGVGGWNWASYISAGSPAFRFYVTGVESLSIGAVYTHNGYSYTIAEVNVTEGAGNILCKTSSKDNVPSVSGILTKSSGDGDDTIVFDEYVVDAQNPLWDAVNNKMSFIPYANEVANGQIDVVYTYLTWNGLSPNMEIGDFSTILSQAKKFADTLHAEFPNAKLKMMAQNPPSVQGGMGANYGANGNNYSDAYGMFLSIMVMNDAYQEFANSEGYSDFVEFVNVSSQFDVENNMQSAEYVVNTRNSKTELLDTNGVHPALEGYYQVADVVYRNFVANFCQ